MSDDEPNPYAGIAELAAPGVNWTGTGPPISWPEMLAAGEAALKARAEEPPRERCVFVSPTNYAAIAHGEARCPICGQTAPHVDGEHPW